MKHGSMKQSLALLLSIAAAGAFAGEARWTRYASNSSVTAYFDAKTPMVRHADGFTISVMDDFKSPLEMPMVKARAMSTTARMTINCRAKTVTVNNLTAYAGPKATGRVVLKNDTESRTEAIQPMSTYGVWYDNACQK